MSQENSDLWSSKHLSKEHRRVEAANQRLVNAKQKKKIPTPFLLLLLLTVGAACFFFAKQNDYIALTASVLIAIGSMVGFSFGFSRILGSLIGVVTAIMFAPGMGIAKETLFTELFSTTGVLNRAISIGTIGVLIAFVVGVIASVILKFIFEARPTWSWGNRWLGFVTGGLKSALVILFLLGGVQAIEPLYQSQSEQLQEVDSIELSGGETENVEFATSTVLKVAEQTRESAVGPLVEKFNPFEMFPQLNGFSRIHKSVSAMNDPEFVSDVLHHSAIQELAETPEVQDSINEVVESEAFKNMAERKEFGRDEIMALLKQPAVLELIETPGFVEKFNQVVDEVSNSN